jgi:lysine-ketoglutarate reductase/saccharopine dehydrogenase-like protein (TIGR00300 family)
MSATEIVQLEGHLIDSLTLAKVLDQIVGSGADYEMLEIDVGRTALDTSRARLRVTAADEVTLAQLLAELQVHGANRTSLGDAELEPADRDGVLPSDFYATTNLPTWVRIEGRWVQAENPEMDCGLVVTAGTEPEGGPAVRTIPMHRVQAGDLIVVGGDGVRVDAPPRPRDAGAFTFMNSDVSSEKPKRLIVSQVADRIRMAHADRVPAGATLFSSQAATSPSSEGGSGHGLAEGHGKVLAVCGPAVVHTGAAPALARLVREGWVDVLFAGNGFATHDIESNTHGTSLGVSLGKGTRSEHGHANHLRTINEIRRYGSIASAVEAGVLRGGVMYECVRHRVPFVLGGSVRDDGPLPDVYTDVVEAADAMRELVEGVSVALMLASTLHAIATGNILPAGVSTYCVDINQAVVTKLTDRGSHQALGIVTDVGLFLGELADILCNGAEKLGGIA